LGNLGRGLRVLIRCRFCWELLWAREGKSIIFLRRTQSISPWALSNINGGQRTTTKGGRTGRRASAASSKKGGQTGKKRKTALVASSMTKRRHPTRKVKGPATKKNHSSRRGRDLSKTIQGGDRLFQGNFGKEPDYEPAKPLS